MGAIASQITSLTIVYSTVYSGADQRKHQRYASLAFVRGIHQRPVNSPHKWPVTRKMVPFDDVIMISVAFNQVVSDYGGLDIVFNNAGVHGLVTPRARVLQINLVRSGLVCFRNPFEYHLIFRSCDILRFVHNISFNYPTF